jgi:hypothetical protein
MAFTKTVHARSHADFMPDMTRNREAEWSFAGSQDRITHP